MEPSRSPSPGSSAPSAAAGRVVVGVDGSSGAQAALEFAVAEAALRGASVHAVHSWQCPVSDGGWVVPVTEYETYARGVLADAVARAAPAEVHRLTEPPVTSDLQEGHPAERLLAAARGAALLVVGSRGHGGFVGLLLGSVSQYCITHATCPVVVVRAPGERHTETMS